MDTLCPADIDDDELAVIKLFSLLTYQRFAERHKRAGEHADRVRPWVSMRWQWIRGGAIDCLYASVVLTHTELPDAGARGVALEAVWPWVWLDGPLHAHPSEEPWTLARPAFAAHGLLVRLQARLAHSLHREGHSPDDAEQRAGQLLVHLAPYDCALPTYPLAQHNPLASGPPPELESVYPRPAATRARRPRWLLRLRKGR